MEEGSAPFDKGQYLQKVRNNFEVFEDVTSDLQELFLKVTSAQAKLNELASLEDDFYFPEATTLLEKGTDYEGRTEKATRSIEDMHRKFVQGTISGYKGFYGIKIPDILTNLIMHTFLDDVFYNNISPDGIVKLLDTVFEEDTIVTIILSVMRHVMITHNKEKFVRECGKDRDIDKIFRTTLKYDVDNTQFDWTDMEQLLKFFVEYRHMKTGIKLEDELLTSTQHNFTQKFNFTPAGLKMINSEAVRNWDKELTWKKGNIYS